MHRARATYDSARPFRAWLFGIAHHLLTDSFRSRGRAPAILGEETIDGRGDVRSPEDVAVARQATDSLQRALALLSPDEATVLVLARLEGLSYEDIATILGRSPAATKQLAYRALKRVRAEMAASGYEEES